MERLPFSRTFGALVVLSTLGLAACNSITGADRLVLDNSDPESQGSGGRGGGGETTGEGAGPSVGGSGGGTSNGGDPSNGGTTTTTTSETTTSTPTTTTTSTTTTTTTNSPVDCQYPDSGFGVNVGSYVSGNLAWQGYTEGAAQSGTVSIQDYFDCDGSKGIHALLIDSSAAWCGPCQEEAGDLASKLSSFQAKGIRVITLMIENGAGNPATLATATTWRDNFGLEGFAVAADPNFSFSGNGSVGLPLQIIVDPRTMKIVGREEGFGDYSTLLNLAQQNAN